MGNNAAGFKAKRKLKDKIIAKYGPVDFYYNGKETVVSKYIGDYWKTIGFIYKKDGPSFFEFVPTC